MSELDLLPLLTALHHSQNPVCLSDRAIFFWQASNAAAQPPALIGDFNGWNPAQALPFTAVAQSPLWYYCQLPLAVDAYVEYAYLQGETRIPDTLNSNRVLDNGMQRGEFNHYFGMGSYCPDSWLQPHAPHLAGQVHTHTLRGDMLVAGGERSVRFYQPHTNATACPLLVVYDGPDYHERALLVQVVDNLIAAGEIRPLVLAMVENGGAARLLEYGCNDVTLGFLMEVVLPFAQSHYPLCDWRTTPGCHGVLGASMGGVMALYSGLRLPHVFGQVFAQAGAYSLPTYYADNFDLVVYPLVEQMQPAALRIWQDCGTLDFLLPTNRRMARLLAARGYQHRYHEYNAGHNYSAWRNQFASGLKYLFPA